MKLLLIPLLLFAVAPKETADAPPRVLDPRLKLELFATEPQIVTPTGITVDSQGNVLAIENHTHFPPKDYDGPKTDRIKRFEDTDGDGKADRITTFYDGSVNTMSVALDRDGSVLVATRDDVFRLRDKDGDGVADERTQLVTLESEDKYPHSGIAGFALDPSGDVYFGLGENHALVFKMTGSDGTVLTNLEGGHIYRCKSNGSKLQRVAIGCWNPHALARDSVGRLFAVDNDPDSLPTCRLLHVVPGGDYGYKYRNGRRGTHPFTSWNGEQPDTLPMAAPTGEAPSGIHVCGGRDKLPTDYRGDLLVTSWGDHRIERYRLRPRGASVSAERVDVVVGGEHFRPVGIVAAGDGAVYFTDWVDKSYTLHKLGRIWKLSALPADEAAKIETTAKLPPASVALSPAELRAESLRSTTDTAQANELWRACEELDPFIRQAAREGLKRLNVVTPEIELKGLNPARRLAALCILRDSNSAAAQARLGDFLRDPDPAIRLVAIKWLGEEKVTSQREALNDVLRAGPTTPMLFAAYLAAMEKLDRPARKDKDEWNNDQYLATALLDASTPVEVRRWALRTLRPDHPDITLARLQAWLASDDEPLRLEAVRTLRDSKLAERDELLWKIIGDAQSSEQLRCEAVVGVSPNSPETVTRLVDLACGNNNNMAREALRSLRGATLDDTVRARLSPLANGATEIADLAARVLTPQTLPTLPDVNDTDAWLKMVDGTGDAAAGARVFFHAKSAACSRCHQIDGRGAAIGPDLSTVARTLERRRLVDSIACPSREIAPQFVTWSLQTDDGQALSGMWLGDGADGSQRYADSTGKIFSLKPEQIELREQQKLSLMPEGLAKLMTVQEFRDLLAFLQQR